VGPDAFREVGQFADHDPDRTPAIQCHRLPSGRGRSGVARDRRDLEALAATDPSTEEIRPIAIDARTCDMLSLPRKARRVADSGLFTLARGARNVELRIPGTPQSRGQRRPDRASFRAGFLCPHVHPLPVADRIRLETYVGQDGFNAAASSVDPVNARP
jgi:hypothetical protein